MLDTSVVNRLSNTVVAIELEDEIAAGRLAVCAPVVHELSHSARNASHLAQIRAAVGTFPMVRTHQATFDRALEVQAELCQTGQHRAVSMADLLIAAAAEAHRLVVIHYDADFERIAEVTGQSAEWVVPRGSID